MHLLVPKTCVRDCVQGKRLMLLVFSSYLAVAQALKESSLIARSLPELRNLEKMANSPSSTAGCALGGQFLVLKSGCPVKLTPAAVTHKLLQSLTLT